MVVGSKQLSFIDYRHVCHTDIRGRWRT